MTRPYSSAMTLSAIALRLFTILVGLGLLAGSAKAQPEKTLFRFTGVGGSAQPDSGFISDQAGNLYGTTNLQNGGVYELSPPATTGGPWTQTTLYQFKGGSDGSSPSGNRLVIDSKGNLYGTNALGGNNNSKCPQGCGTVYELSPPASGSGAWTETIIYRLPGGAGGSEPLGLTLLPGGMLVVSVYLGGDSAGDGLILGLQPPAVSGGTWSKRVLYTFQGGADGSEPNAAFVTDKNRNLYSTTDLGGTGTACPSGCGTVFEFSPPAAGSTLWTKTTIHSFQGAPNDGYLPEHGLILDAAGNLYGTTFQGGPNAFGTAFELTPPTVSGGSWTESVLHTFNGAPDGFYPNGLVMDASGNLYGATAEGGSGLFQGGIVYRLSPPTVSGGSWTQTILHNFPTTANDGNGPQSPPLVHQGNLFGVTFAGGGTAQCPSGCGMIYEVQP